MGARRRAPTQPQSLVSNMPQENARVIADLIAALKEAKTVNQIARLTRLLLREVGVFNTHPIGLEIARQAITYDPNEGRVSPRAQG